jgi:predicted metalloprotease with PDZ domain
MKDVVAALQRIAPHDWQSYFHEKLYVCSPDAPLGGLVRGGYELVYRDTPNEYSRKENELSGSIDLSFSVGLILNKGAIQEVLWESPAYAAGLTAGDAILAVAGKAYSTDGLKVAVGTGAQFELVVKHNKRVETVIVACNCGHRYPHLAERSGKKRLDEILSPL